MCERKRAFCSINGIEDMAGSPFVRVVVTCCVLACSLIAMTAAQPCAKNQRLVRNVACDFFGPVACALNPTMWVQPNGGRPYCDWCEWGKYSDSNENTCRKCPLNTVIMQGSYNQVYNYASVNGNWCEANCGVAFRNLLQYPIPGQVCDFCSDLFSPFVDSQIPCINSGKRDLSGSTFVKNNQMCTDIDFKIAETLIVKWETSTQKFTSGYESQVTLAEKIGSNLVVSVEPEGGQRKCQFCPPGHYKKRNENSCVTCPNGMISARVTDDAKLFIPDDVKKLTEQYFPGSVFPAVDYVAFGCRACSVQNGVPQMFVCTQCQQNAKQYEKYQHAEKVQIEGGNFLVVGTECRFCPPGYEYYNRKAGSDKTPCISMNGVLDCCRICLPNSFSAGNGARCQKIDVTQASTTSYGATAPKSCALGEELVYCSVAGLCMSTPKIGWRACKSCSLTETSRADESKHGFCKECASEGKHLVDTTTSNTCKQCSTCHALELSSEEHVLHTIPDKTEIRESIVAWGENGVALQLLDFTYKTQKITADCTPLSRRTITNNDFSGIDLYRPRQEKQDTAIVPLFHTLIRTEANCTLTSCEKVCSQTRFHYSPACGPQEDDLTKIWVLHNSAVKQYKTLSETDKQTKLYVQHGPCEMCKPCVKGMYNAKCNVYGTALNPEGICDSCLTQCPAGFFMFHSDKEAGCHAPPDIFRHSNTDLWKITENYNCQKCPTWVRDSDKIYIVTACGVTEKYKGWSWDLNSNLVSTQIPVVYSNWEQDYKLLGESYKNYRSFARDLVAYCPVAYFYDERIAGCSLSEQQPQLYSIPGTAGRTVSIGYSDYNPNCCKPCTTCSHSKKKDTSNWKACMGDSVVNSQDFCVERCGAMYWENVTARECRRCSTCDSGFLL